MKKRNFLCVVNKTPLLFLIMDPQLSPPIYFFPKWMSHIFIRNYRRKWQPKKIPPPGKWSLTVTYLQTIENCYLPGAANVYNLPICKQCDFGPRVFFLFKQSLYSYTKILERHTIVSAYLYSVPYIFMQHIFWSWVC